MHSAQRASLAGLGLHAQQTVDGQGDPTVYLHGDMVRSTMLTTDEVGAPVTRLAYTAFGEPVTDEPSAVSRQLATGESPGRPSAPDCPERGDPAAPNSALRTLNSALPTRYGYAGGFGYESGLITLQGVNPALPPVTLQHVGERWYDPALGRFVQRDPIGMDGGANVYLYCGGNPAAEVDPLGLVPPEPGTCWDDEAEFLASRPERERRAALLVGGGLTVGGWLLPFVGPAFPWAARTCVIVAVHGPYHYFPWLGAKLPHIQIIIYEAGVKGSHTIIRIPLPVWR